jgi:hypothetical protein
LSIMASAWRMPFVLSALQDPFGRQLESWISRSWLWV